MRAIILDRHRRVNVTRVIKGRIKRAARNAMAAVGVVAALALVVWWFAGMPAPF